MNVKKELFKYKNNRFKDFEANLVPNIDPELIIGTKSKYQNKIAKELYLSGEYMKFVNNVPHKYLEENLVHSHLISYFNNYSDAMFALNKILPYIDNWMVSDTISSKTFLKNKDKLLKFIYSCLKKNKTYYIRVGILLLKKYFLDDDFNKTQMMKALCIKHDDYYVKMMQAWYIADGLIKHKKEFLNILKSKKLDKFVQNKSIQKARESYRISDSLKRELLKYKI